MSDRSLCPKITSLIDCINEMRATIAVVTETWPANGELLDKDTADLAYGAGLGLLCRNRPPNAHGVARGGVAIVFRKPASNMKMIDLPYLDAFEVLVALGNLPGYKEKLVTIACYLKDKLNYLRSLPS